ncbi:DAK2 domain-containing protein [Actinokineospora sp. NBRC 105648]|uniref:DAK2 domain-containing protein n=1 Tax=Actinokineospora sp. NBRC 105648 TaxID=3032206 RepID=UPI00249FF500|nr:DAK2 domain-containing protein [Actinokineospora sp. NBRC 105648]GLZ41722.1 dihydroxyacetone kinase [Actinokineospora sp. NBRC 105648]
MLEALDAGEVRRWVAACVQSLDAHRVAIDRINVYPVADGDTGSNLLSTLRSALEALLRAPAADRVGAGDAFAVLAKGALTGARGNSGVIISQVLRGMAEAVRGQAEITGPVLRSALREGARLASAAVSTPVPGTMLTVLDAAAAAEGPDGLHDVASSAAQAAAVALDHTPELLGVLAEAGVVDAGGRGVVVLLDALVAVVAGQPAAIAAAARVRAEEQSAAAHHSPADRNSAADRHNAAEHSLVAAREAGSGLYGYEVMYLLTDTDEAAVTTLRHALDRLGDCVSVVGDGGDLWTVHVHCNDVGAAIEAGIDAGRPRRIRVARFADAVPESPDRFTRDRAVVAPVRGDELAELFLAEGVAVLRVGTGEPTAYELLDVITGTGAAHVTVLPADTGLMAIADEAAIRAVAAGQDVVVVPCASPVQALAAIAVHDPRRRAADDVVAMAEASAATRRGEVVVAAQDAITWIGPCAAGDVLGFADGEVVLIEPGPPGEQAYARAAVGVVRRMLAAGGELVTVLLGQEAPDDLTEALSEFLRHERPDADLIAYRGGQADSVLTFGLE